ncbi:hypothetical protein BC940DRAFT_311149 [Gongronella butleri]|nr:hypothetical protein BC940DRAFT_311149 [Gongronella butleri]
MPSLQQLRKLSMFECRFGNPSHIERLLPGFPNLQEFQLLDSDYDTYYYEPKVTLDHPWFPVLHSIFLGHQLDVHPWPTENPLPLWISLHTSADNVTLSEYTPQGVLVILRSRPPSYETCITIKVERNKVFECLPDHDIPRLFARVQEHETQLAAGNSPKKPSTPLSALAEAAFNCICIDPNFMVWVIKPLLSSNTP